MKVNKMTYSPEQIRTANMLPDRSTDLVFDSKLEPSLTQQQFSDFTDINKLIAQYEKTGLLTHVNSRQPIYGDFSNVSDYQSAYNAVIQAQAAFAVLPADVRERFANDPQQLLSFLSDPKNKQEAIKLGLVNPETPASSEVEKPIANASSEA